MMSSNNLNASYIINEVKPLVSVNVSLDSSDYEFSWNKWIEDEDHFIKDGPNTYQLCGNQSSALLVNLLLHSSVIIILIYVCLVIL